MIIQHWLDINYYIRCNIELLSNFIFRNTSKYIIITIWFTKFHDVFIKSVMLTIWIQKLKIKNDNAGVEHMTLGNVRWFTSHLSPICKTTVYHLGVALRCDLCFPIDSKRFFSINTNLIKFILICTLCIYYGASVYYTFIVNDCSIGEMWMTILQHLLSANFLMIPCPETLAIAENYVFRLVATSFPMFYSVLY